MVISNYLLFPLIRDFMTRPQRHAQVAQSLPVIYKDIRIKKTPVLHSP